ncbi:light-sensor Protein kinase-like [Macadamia integrifolia]|uniref:light-sensor Protein kinase-like n=1 Tax=Macadamia integrifolia TaxID=60698 RepID=UPI001C4F5BA9|nr:light-sensor Protein kinase-like [Macadamia integrifolia]
MEQFRQIGKVLGSLKALMVFQNDIRVNQRQCCLLFDIFNLTFQGIAEELKQNLRFEEKHIKWKALEHPLRELHRVFKEGEAYVQQCMDNKDWLAKVICLSQNTDCMEFHIHNLLSCIPVVIEAIETAGEISGCDQDEILKKRVVLSKKYEREWMDPKIFRWNFGKQYLVSQDICKRLDKVWKEDRRLLLETIKENRSSGSGSLAKQEQRLMELLLKNLDHNKPSDGWKLFPSSILVGSKDYQVKRRLGSGSQFKEVQWLGESFVLRNFFGEIEPAIPEISLLSSLAHPNILQFLCGFSDEEKKESFLVMELMNKDLISCIKELCGPRRKVPFSLPIAVDLMLQIARGMEYLHSQKIYHGDLNPYNVLVRPRNSLDGYLHAKISGFGLSSITNSTPRTSSNQNEAPFIWYAPEVLLEQEQPQPGTTSSSKYTEKADIYSFGMICFELLTGKVPFEDGHLQGDKMSRNIRAGERPLFPFHLPKYLTNLTKKCWHTDPTQRPSFSSIGRILRYIKRFLVLNPDHSHPDPPLPLVDYCDIEAWFSKKFAAEGNPNPAPVSQIPFEMFSFRVMEKERINLNFKDRSSESGSDSNSVCGDENAALMDDDSLCFLSGTPKGRALRPPHMTQCGRCLRMNSESHIVVMSPSRRRTSGHASDSELA